MRNGDIRVGTSSSSSNGCGPMIEGACPTEVLVAPRFYDGELLTARDLDAILAYTRSRLALDRYRDGWGVACGLGVGLDPDSDSRVLVGCGYALDPRGQDILVPVATPFDLGDLAGGTPAQGECLVAADLYILHETQEIDPRPTLASNPCCRDMGPICQPAGTLDAYRLEARSVPPDDDPLQPEVVSFQAAWDATSDVVLAFYRTFQIGCGGQPSGSSVRAWLQQWICRHPIYQLAWIADAVRNLPDSYSQPDTVRVLFFLVQDARLRLIAESTACASCGDVWAGTETCGGVLLARIFMTNGAIVRIDTMPPYRRPLVRETWPAPLGQVNLVQMIWNRWVEARRRIADLGLASEKRQVVPAPTTYQELDIQIASEIFGSPGHRDTAILPRVLDPNDAALSSATTTTPVGRSPVIGFDLVDTTTSQEQPGQDLPPIPGSTSW